MTIELFIRKHLPTYKNKDFELPFDVEEKIIDRECIITPYKKVENKVMLLREGIVQICTLKEDEEKILEFVFPGNFFCAYTSFLMQEPSDVQVIALTKCNVCIIKRDDLEHNNDSSLVASHLSLYIARQLFLSRAKREKELLTLSAEERYKMLLEKNPEIIKMIPGNKIAKYLGIQAESLSRIRKSIIP